jgi:N-acetylglucosamine kinase-like BadF-type ATPase
VGVSRSLVVAVDGGGSKSDVAVVDAATGVVVGRHRGPGCSQHELGPAEAAAVIDTAVRRALADAGADPAAVGHAGCYLTAVDLPDEEATMHALLSTTAWGGLSLTVANDLFALLRAGTDEADAAVVVCGTGVNGAAVRADGTVARIPALGRCSGDWGGGAELAEEVLWLAARAEDGRGDATALREALLAWTGLGSVAEVAVAVHRGSLSSAAWRDRMPEVFALAASGDAAAARLVTRQGRELGLLAGALLSRVGLAGATVPVVLGGGIGASGDRALLAAAAAALAERAPAARLVPTATPPVVGAVALALARARETQL